MNTWTGLGRVAGEFKVNDAGTVADGCVAICKTRKGINNEDITDFINIKITGAERVTNAQKYLVKGIKILVTGQLQVDRYTDRDGNNRSYYYILVRDWEFADSKEANERVRNSSYNSVGNTDNSYREESNNKENTKGKKNKQLPKGVSEADGFMNIDMSVEDEGLPFT